MRTYLTKLKEWERLSNHFEFMNSVSIKSLFDKDRASLFSIKDKNLFFDYSKNNINTETMELLFQLADAVNLYDEIEK